LWHLAVIGLALEQSHYAVLIRTCAPYSFTRTPAILRYVTPLLDKRLVYVTGKGGVGKTTVAAALGLMAARQGKRTIVCEVAEQERISTTFGIGPVGYEETEVAPGLSAISIDPERSKQEWLRYQLPSGTLARVLGHSRIFQYLSAAAPGLNELVTIGKLWELAQLERKKAAASPYDLVIVDAPASGHGVAMLRAPLTYADVARVGPIRRQALKIHSFLVDPAATGVLVVALPEEMPVNETLDLERRLPGAVGAGLDAIVVNGMWPERFSAAEAGTLREAERDGHRAAAGPALRAALSAHERARAQRTHLRRLRREAAARVITLPFVFETELGLPEYERLAGDLARRL
jgi:anion-transporting  ArsA/GET3 family ATPase